MFAGTETACGLRPPTRQLDAIAPSPPERLPTLSLLKSSPSFAPAGSLGVWVFAGRARVVGGTGVKVPEKVFGALRPAVTSAVGESPPVTLQLDATPESTTGWLPAGRPEKVTPLLLVAIDWLIVSSTV